MTMVQARRAPPPDLSRLGDAILDGGLIILGISLPIVLSAMIPGSMRMTGAASMALLSIGVMLGAFGVVGVFGYALSAGFVLASVKLLTGIRFI